MPQPTAYTRKYNFANYQTSNPTDPVPADQLEAEFNAVKQTTDETLANLALIQRDDGKLKNSTVHADSLSAAVRALTLTEMNPRGNWATSTSYAVKDVVERGSTGYICMAAHTSGVFDDDHAAGRWLSLGTAEADVTSYRVVATGSTTPRTLADWFADVANVLGYGAVGDGAADDAPAVVAAIDTGYPVVFRGVTYKMSEPMVPQFLQKIDGRGARIEATEDTPLIDIPDADDTDFSNFTLVGLGKGQGTTALVDFTEGGSANRTGLHNVWFRDGKTAIDVSGGWGYDFDRLYVNGFETGLKCTVHEAAAGWATSGYIVSNSYFADCDIAIQDTAAWNATYINVVMEYCGKPIVQSQTGSTSVWVNPWLEANDNPPEWRRDTVIIGGQSVPVSDIALWAGDPDLAVTVVREGIAVHRSPTSTRFRATGRGVTRFDGVLDEIGFTSHRDSDAASGVQILPHAGEATKRGIFAGQAASSDTISENAGLVLNNYSSYFGGSVADAITTNSPNSQIRMTAARSGSGSGRAIGTIQFLTAVSDGADHGTLTGRLEVGNGWVRPMEDNTTALGGASNLWTEVFAATAAINTSDGNLKQDVEELEAAELAVAQAIKGLFRKFRFRDAVARKGDGARIHIGVIAQDVEALFAQHGLDASRYALFCRDVWWEHEGQPVEVDEEGVYTEEFWLLDGERVEPLDADGRIVREHWELDGVEVQPDAEGKYPHGAEKVVTELFAERQEVRHQAVRKERLGIRYEELLAFVLAAG